MEKKERLQKALNYLRLNGYVSSQVDAARKIGASESSISNALKGSERYLTEKFLHRFNDAFNGIFNIDWLLYGDGEMITGSLPTNQESDEVEKLKTELERIKSLKLPENKDKIVDVWLRFMEIETQRYEIEKQRGEIMLEMVEIYKQNKGE